VTGLLKDDGLLGPPGFAIDRFDRSDSQSRQDALLQELTEFSPSANNQYGPAILGFASLTAAGFSFCSQHYPLRSPHRRWR
jgi:hypothetical protein